jgi:hypothetical protein
MRLDFQHPPGHVKELLWLTLHLYPDFTRPQARQQWRVARRDTDLAHFRRRKHHIGGAGENLSLGADDINVKGHCHSIDLALPATGYSFLAFSTASSMVPTM